MEYLTVRETSEKWGMSIRMVNYYLNTGRIEGAVRKKSEWLIPYTAKSPLDIRKKADILNQLLIIVLLHGIIFMDNILSILGLFMPF